MNKRIPTSLLYRQKGAVLSYVIVAIGLAGTLAAAAYHGLHTLTRGTTVTANVLRTDAALAQAAYFLAAEGVDGDNDGFTESSAMQAGDGPADGGVIPDTSGAPKTDGWGRALGYCAWDAGSTDSSTGRLSGDNPASPTSSVFAVLSPGANGTFDTTCAQSLTGALGDDRVVLFTQARIAQGVGGTIFWGDPVADATALNALDTAALREGETRLVKGEDKLYRWDSTGASWASLSGGFEPDEAANYLAREAVVSTTAGKDNNVAIGPQALNPSATGDANIALGPNALSGATSGSYNFAAGDGALYTLASGSGNVAIGLRALNAGHGGSDSIAIGRYAQEYMRTYSGSSTNIALGQFAMRGSATPTQNTGTHNFAAGSAALTGLTSGSYNVAAGTYALTNTTTGSQNAAIGPWALQSNTTGNDNIAVGYSALRANTVGSHSIALGRGAQQSMRSSSNSVPANNIAFGYNAMNGSANPAANTGRNNTAIGEMSLYSLTSGSYNFAAGTRALYSNSSGLHNVAIGFYALNATQGHGNIGIGDNAQRNTMGSYNIALGSNALRGSVTPASNTGTSNFAAGFQTLYNNTSGGHNFAAGWTALTKNTTGTGNVAIGGNALANNDVGSYSVAVGYDAQTFMVGGYNVAVGYSALRGSTAPATNTGSNNVAFGTQALYANSSGSYNFAAGHHSLQSNTSGSYNTAIGITALSNNTTGNGNFAVGSSALGANTTGSHSIAVGAYAQQYMRPTFNGYNVAFGIYALRGSNDPTANTGTHNFAVGNAAMMQNSSGSNNVALGWNALAANTTGWNNLAVGQNAMGGNTTGSNNIALGQNALIGAATSHESIAIGTSAQSRMAPVGAAYNVAIGASALSGSATVTANTGTYNTAAGYHALLNNSSGRYNVGLGASALAGNATGTYNAALGAGADVGSPNLTYATAVGAGTVVNSSNTVALGRSMDTVHVAGDIVIDGNGTVGGVTITSDARLKTNVVPIRDSLASLRKLQGVTYDWKDAKANRTIAKMGFIAQEVEEVLPGLNLVYTDTDGNKSLAYPNLVALAVEGVKAVDARVEELAEVVTLTGVGVPTHVPMLGDQAGLYYRGEAILEHNGCTVVRLPSYFEAVARPGGRTVHLTPWLSKGPAPRLAASGVERGLFEVCGEPTDEGKGFWWEVKAVREAIRPAA